MKNILLIILVIFSNLTYSQQTYPLHYEGKSDVANGSYFKDLDGELDPYVGLWKGDWNGKTVFLYLKKIKYYNGSNGDGYFQDRILGERKIIGSNGVVEIDRISNFDLQFPEFTGIDFKFSNPSQSQLYFVPKNMCGKTANLDITFLNPEKTQISLHFIYRPSYIDESCPYFNSVMQGNDYPINFPKDIVLTKQ